MPAHQGACPHCQAVLKANTPIAFGKTIRCAKCSAAFPVGVGLSIARAARVPVAMPLRQPPNSVAGRAGRLAAVLGGMLLLVGGSAALVVYCFTSGANANGGGPAPADGGYQVPLVAVQPSEPGREMPPAPKPVAAATVPDVEPVVAKGDAPAPVEPPPSRPAPDLPPQPLRPPPAAAVLPTEQERINNAIDRGVKYLKAAQLNSGRWSTGPHAVGYTALPGLTLLECGVPAGDPVVQRAAKFVRQHAQSLDATYELALALLFLDRLSESRDRSLIQTLALRLIAGQNTTGGWTYRCPLLNLQDQKHLLAFLRRHQTQPLPNAVVRTSGGATKALSSPGPGPLANPLTNARPAEVGRAIPKASSASEPGLLQPIDVGPAPLAQPDGESVTASAPKPMATPKATQKKGNTPSKASRTDPLPAKLKGLTVVHMNSGAVKQGKTPGKAKPKVMLRGTSGDNSNTQFAILALWVGRRHGIPMERTLALVDHRFQTSQNADGGWGYHYLGDKGFTTPSMTCVGLLGLAVGHGFAQETGVSANVEADMNNTKVREQDPAIQRGLQKLGQYVGSPDRNRRVGGPVNLYFLWSLERVGVLYNLKTIGNKDWYGWAAQLLQTTQNADGSWWTRGYHGSSNTIDTCLALLILQRTNLVQDLTENLRILAITDPDAGSRASGR
jgi:hypothetical protein